MGSGSYLGVSPAEARNQAAACPKQVKAYRLHWARETEKA